MERSFAWLKKIEDYGEIMDKTLCLGTIASFYFHTFEKTVNRQGGVKILVQKKQVFQQKPDKVS